MYGGGGVRGGGEGEGGGGGGGKNGRYTRPTCSRRGSIPVFLKIPSYVEKSNFSRLRDPNVFRILLVRWNGWDFNFNFSPEVPKLCNRSHFKQCFSLHRYFHGLTFRRRPQTILSHSHRPLFSPKCVCVCMCVCVCVCVCGRGEGLRETFAKTHDIFVVERVFLVFCTRTMIFTLNIWLFDFDKDQIFTQVARFHKLIFSKWEEAKLVISKWEAKTKDQKKCICVHNWMQSQSSSNAQSNKACLMLKAFSQIIKIQ